MDRKQRLEYNKKRIYEIVEVGREHDFASKAYDLLMFVAVVIGLIPLTLKNQNVYSDTIDIITSGLFLVDYIIRLFTADYKMGVKNIKAYIYYAKSPMAIIDLLSIVPILTNFFPMFKLFRFFRIIRIFRLLKLIRYSKTMVVIENIFRRIKGQLLAIMIFVLVYIVAIAMVMYQIEPDIFGNFYDAIYWSTISITTIGYGDISPVTTMGRMINVFSSLVGVGIVAIPTALITASYMEEIRKEKGRHEL